MCHFYEEYEDWSKPRMLFKLLQVGADDDPYLTKLKMQGYNMGEGGSMLSVSAFTEDDCAGDAKTVIDGKIKVRERWGRTRFHYWNRFWDKGFADFGESLQL